MSEVALPLVPSAKCLVPWECSMSVSETRSPLIHRKLSALRRSLRAHLAGRGLCWLTMVLSGGVLLTLGIDYSLHLDRAQRGFIDALVLAAVGAVTWRFL